MKIWYSRVSKKFCYKDDILNNNNDNDNDNNNLPRLFHFCRDLYIAVRPKFITLPLVVSISGLSFINAVVVYPNILFISRRKPE